jgi:hypothetical protein
MRANICLIRLASYRQMSHRTPRRPPVWRKIEALQLSRITSLSYRFSADLGRQQDLNGLASSPIIKVVNSPQLPPGTRFLDVEGIPVALIPLQDGGLKCEAFDSDPPRPFPLSSAYNNGAVIPQAQWDALRASAHA